MNYDDERQHRLELLRRLTDAQLLALLRKEGVLEVGQSTSEVPFLDMCDCFYDFARKDDYLDDEDASDWAHESAARFE